MTLPRSEEAEKLAAKWLMDSWKPIWPYLTKRQTRAGFETRKSFECWRHFHGKIDKPAEMEFRWK